MTKTLKLALATAALLSFGSVAYAENIPGNNPDGAYQYQTSDLGADAAEKSMPDMEPTAGEEAHAESENYNQ